MMAKNNNKVKKRKPATVKKDSEEAPVEKNEKKDPKVYERITKGTESSFHKIWTRTVIIISMMTVMYYYSNFERDVQLALQNEHIILRFHKRDCSRQFLDDIKDYPKCLPQKCGRFVMDTLISVDESRILFEYGKLGIALGGSSGGASILDLHSGALSKGKNFINAYDIPNSKKVFTKDFAAVYQTVTEKIKHAIAMNFQVDESSLYLTRPTFFSRIDNVTAKTIHDEYWHRHVDKEQYEAFHYTTLLYLNDYRKDFTGGRFIFIDGTGKNDSMVSIEPKIGRVNAFTSGHENVHYIEKVTSGIRYAITISFTCNSDFQVNPNLTTKFKS